MNLNIFCVFGAIIVLPSNGFGFNILKEFLSPRFPTVTKLRHAEDARANVDDFAIFHTVAFIELAGYPYEEHNLTTEDGYNIEIFRIPGSPKYPVKPGKPVVFMQHGFLSTSETWVAIGAGKDLAFLLADAGYDVWLANTRGNSYGRSHTHLSTQDPDFWEFSYHELATRDLPNMIDHVLDVSGQKSLFYIGHSMGTTMGFVLLSEMPEYNEKVRLVIALAPVVYWGDPASTIVGLFIRSIEGIEQYFMENDMHYICPQSTVNVVLGKALCSVNSIWRPFCVRFYGLFAGDATEQLNNTFLPNLFSYYPAGGSTKTFLHFGQNFKSGTFKKYDAGYTENLKLYGKDEPPMYDIEKISAPVALIYGKKDAIATGSNAMKLAKRLQNVVTCEAVPFDDFNHFDFIWAKDANILLYNRIIELMSAHIE